MNRREPEYWSTLLVQSIGYPAVANTFSRTGRKDDSEPLVGKNKAPKDGIKDELLDNNLFNNIARQ